MKLSVSNIAWDNCELDAHLKLLKDLDCDGVEIAPSCIWKEPIDATAGEVGYIKKIFNKYNLLIPAFHALLYTRPDLYLFGDGAGQKEMMSYLKGLIRLAGSLSVKFLIYGSPKSRHVGDKPYDKCYDIAVDTFRELAKEAELHDTCLCIEPLGPSENDFIQVADEGYRLLKDVNSYGFGLHLDAKAMVDTKEDFNDVFRKYGGILKHFHVGDPGLAPPGYTGFDHSLIGKALLDSSYKGFVSVEMRRGFGDTKEVVKDAVAYVRKNYFLRDRES